MLDNLLLLGLTTWRVAYALVSERGPFDVLVKLRKMIGIDHNEDNDPVSYPDTFFGNLLSCVYCTSVWVALALCIPNYLLPAPWFAIISFPFAVSTVAIIIDTVVEKY